MHLGYVCLPGDGETDRLLAEVAARLKAQGLALAGAVQVNSHRPGRRKADMDLHLLPGGPVVRISIDRGEGATGCRLDTAALEEAAVVVARRVEGADVLFLNKFGKQEAEGHGFADSLAEALSQGIPVVVGMVDHFLEGFLAFADGHAAELPGEVEGVLDWIAAARRERAA
ncbi:DUF2478 domain-containing protein [Pseudogemmobacter sonorensis]|uniref:DUF2478 domain-containing protein n=1 Tax=Pseudogemmobacter sonorensis TaxID=2989681 RepID=UPI0036C87A58